MAMPSAPVNTMSRLRIISASPSPAERVFAPLAVYQFFHKLYALEIQKLRVLLLTPVERHGHLPGTREDLRVLDGRLVRDHIRAGARVTLHHVERVAMIIPGPIEPGLVVHSGYVDHQRVAFPVADRLPHPGVDGSSARVFHIDIAHRPGVLVSNEDCARVLHDLEWVGHVGGARDAGKIALDFRIS